MKCWGFHFIMDCYECDLDKVTDAKNIKNFATNLVEAIGMKAYGRPKVIHFGEDEKAGYTLMQLIETSNISAHFCDATGDAYIDVFSCMPFDKDVVIEMVREYFAPKSSHNRFIERGVKW